MNDPTFNLLQLEQRPNWYDHLDAVIAEMINDRRVSKARTAANWTADEGGWYSPCGMHESDWADEDYPFPEDSDYSDWASAFYHYDALDSATPTP